MVTLGWPLTSTRGLGAVGVAGPAMGAEHRGAEMEEGAGHLRSPSARRC